MKVILFIGIILLLGDTPSGLCEPTRADLSERVQMQKLDQKTTIGGRIGKGMVSVFRDFISPVDGDRCPSVPSCSAYSCLAFEKHGFFLGWIMTVDRLFHEADEKAVSPLVLVNGRLKILDPVENNDFWWFDGNDAEQE